MKILVAEDDFASRLLLRKLLAPYGEVHVAVDAREAIRAFRDAESHGAPYGLICLGIMMPAMDGKEVLEEIHRSEEARGVKRGKGVKIIMTSALSDVSALMAAFRDRCDAYLAKPIEQKTLRAQMASFGISA